ncbi:MAG: glycosyltransferase [Solobacterium sp.]|nr:glycosyltransferase [Solobacterium sp.]
MDKKTTVIVPVYNVQNYLLECLESIIAQTEENLEILCVNDGSTDNSREILAEFSRRDERIKILDKPNGGLSDARNFALDRAAGDYIACVDSDDRIHPDMIAHLRSALEETGSDIAVSDMEYFYEDGTAKQSDGGRFTCTSVRETPALIAINNSACNKLFRRELFADIRFPKGKFYEDLAVIPILLYRAGKVVKVDEPLYAYRQRQGSIAHSSDPRIFDIYDALDGIVNYVKAHGNEPEVLAALKSLYIVHGLDLTTLRIRDFSDRSIRADYLRKNMARLRQSYPDYDKDPALKQAGFKKKVIYHLLKTGRMEQVLKLYDR